jgi:hypothetical protein
MDPPQIERENARNTNRELILRFLSAALAEYHGFNENIPLSIFFDRAFRRSPLAVHSAPSQAKQTPVERSAGEQHLFQC